jgi:hypothetical protein
MPAFTSIAIGALVVGTAVNVATSIGASKASNRAARARATLDTIKTQRAKRQQVAEARKARGTAINTAALSGTQGSSGEAGATSSILAQLGTNLSFLDTNLSLNQFISQQNTAASNLLLAGSVAKSVGNTTASIAAG